MRPAAPLPRELRSRPFHVRRAAELGVTRGRLGARDLSAPFRGVRVAARPVGLLDLCRAYAERMPERHVFSHETAAGLWGLPMPSLGALPLHVSAPAPLRQPRVAGVVGHRLGSGIRTTHLAGLPLVAPGDAWCQLAASLGHDDLVSAGDRLVGWRSPLVTLDEIDAAIERFGPRHGAKRLRAARGDIRPGSASRRETRLRLRVVRAGFPEPELNTPIRLGAGWTAYGDLVFGQFGVLLEYDGEQHRADEVQFHRDVERLNDLAADGWIVIRVGRRLPPARALDQLERALRARGWHGIRVR
ncbi:hypothetical protein [Agromyces binzhouensis]|uniref:DUF559 domain-containing protein n=1 Tax=Agromyces binzhouensis TaxID=1817495 RepID=A0A4Q2JS78_9MICO|nr:hypothetical protein [Agromyces binzhouensis]RXZ49836.1 hypothetical protein ESO86_05030 [Agromyces binzhouensis]